MNQPTTTELDPRFSDAGAIPTTWEQTLETIESAGIFWITTVRTDGRPHVSPLVAVWLDDALHFCTGPGEQKALNLRENQHVALTTGDSRWDSGLDVVVEGDAVRVTDQAKLIRLAQAWAGKWDGQWVFEARDGAFYDKVGNGIALVFAVKPTKILSFGKGSFSHTRHRF